MWFKNDICLICPYLIDKINRYSLESYEPRGQNAWSARERKETKPCDSQTKTYVKLLPRSNGRKAVTIISNRPLFAYSFTLNRFFLTFKTYWKAYHGVTGPLPYIDLIYFRYNGKHYKPAWNSHVVASFVCCCRRKCHATRGGTRLCNKPTSDTALVTLRWRRRTNKEEIEHSEQKASIEFTKEIE